MSAEESRIERLITLFENALALPSAERSEFLEKACGDDVALRTELSSLLAAHESATDYFENLGQEIVSPAFTALAASGRTAAGSVLLSQIQAELGNAYRVEQELPGGNMSRVFLGEDVKLGRKVVIKVLPPEFAADARADRFRREIQLAAQLQHPHIVPLLASDATESLVFYTMPFVEGESLRARLAREGPLSIKDACGIWDDVLDALAHAHARGIIHRDIKPGNILLHDRNALVTDFGIAKAIEAAGGDERATEPGFAIGTPAYMAPEQLTGDGDADRRVDIYAAGLVMYEMLEGRLPFYGDTTSELALARLAHEPDPVGRPDCPPELAELVQSCLARNPAARPESADAILTQLEAVPSGVVARAPRSISKSDASGSEASAGQVRAADVRVGLASRTHRRSPLIAVYSLVTLLLAAAVFGAWRLASAPAESTAASDPQASIAVFPLTNLSATPADAALAEGMTEELIAILGRTGNMRVIASSSVVALKSRQLDVRQIAESLGVSHVLEGAFQKVGSRFRMQVRLVDPRDRSTRWSETYDREIGDIFAIQDDIARAVALELDVRLTPGVRSALPAHRYVPRIAAYEFYLQARSSHLLRTRSGIVQGIEYFKRAIAADSNYAAAYAGLSEMYLQRAGTTPGDYARLQTLAIETARQAVALDDSLAEAHSSLGWAQLAGRDWAGAERELKTATALDPAVHRGYEGLARLYMMTGRPAEQLAAARRGLESDPFSVQALREMALALTMNDRCDEALELLSGLKDLSPPAGVAGVVMGQCYAIKEMWPEAIAEFRWVIQNSDARTALAFLGYSLARGGQKAEAMTILSDLLSGRKYSHGAFGIAMVYTGLRDYDQAFAWLDKAVDENSWRVYLMSPLFDDLHRDSRFVRIRTRMGLGTR